MCLPQRRAGLVRESLDSSTDRRVQSHWIHSARHQHPRPPPSPPPPGTTYENERRSNRPLTWYPYSAGTERQRRVFIDSGGVSRGWLGGGEGGGLGIVCCCAVGPMNHHALRTSLWYPYNLFDDYPDSRSLRRVCCRNATLNNNNTINSKKMALQTHRAWATARCGAVRCGEDIICWCGVRFCKFVHLFLARVVLWEGPRSDQNPPPSQPPPAPEHGTRVQRSGWGGGT